MKSWTQPTVEMIEKVLSSVKKEIDRQYFFSRLNNPLWLEPLYDRGYFNKPPGMKQLPDGYVQYPHWPELGYLVNIATEATDKIVDIVLSLPKTDNPRVYEDVLSIALKLDRKNSAKLYPKLIEYIKLDNQFLAHRYPELLNYWTEQGNVTLALNMVKLIVPFKEDPKAKYKHRLRKKRPNSTGSSLESAPHFGEWEYQQILESGVRPIAEHEPFLLAQLLINVVTDMIHLDIHPEDIEKGRDEDYSEIWCRYLDRPDNDYHTPKEVLVHTLTHVCEKVYSEASESCVALDQELKNHRWNIFNRLRQHLYALYPNDQSLPWIRQQIIEHDDYSKWDHHYEFQLMIRKACEHFGARLLCKEELKDIFDAILRGPSKKDFREWLGESYTEDDFQQRQRHFHHKQLRPFYSVLSPEVKLYFDDLEGKTNAESIEDENYAPYGEVKTGTVSYQSPISNEELEGLPDEDIFTYLNNWNEEHRNKDNWLIEVNISALANVFQSFFKEKILQDESRFPFWIENRGRIKRPIHITAMLKAMHELIKEKNFNNIDQWLNFGIWVLSLTNSEKVEDQPEPSKESSSYPDWSSSRQAVVDLIDSCVNKEVNAPIEAREDIAGLLKLACTQLDWRLDQGKPVLLNCDDPITEAINNIRSRALRSLINFSFWVRSYLPKDDLQEMTEILNERITDANIPLTRPEKALIGMHYGNLCTLNPVWAVQHVKTFFPQENTKEWQNAFGNFIRYNRPMKLAFEILRSEYEFAIERLNTLAVEEEKGSSKDLVNKLGQHLFTYYLWDVYPLSGDESLLEPFYTKTQDDPTPWGHLFNHIGRLLRNSGKHLDKELTARIIAFFDWRFEIGETLELQEFTFWLEAECLEPEWRLLTYSKILDHKHVNGRMLSLHVRTLNKLSTEYLALALECFTKITNAMEQGTQMYIIADDAKAILRMGLNSEDSITRNNAKHARENLLRLGRLDYMEI